MVHYTTVYNSIFFVSKLRRDQTSQIFRENVKNYTDCPNAAYTNLSRIRWKPRNNREYLNLRSLVVKKSFANTFGNGAFSVEIQVVLVLFDLF